MKIRILSDLHQGFEAPPVPMTRVLISTITIGIDVNPVQHEHLTKTFVRTEK